MYFVFFQKSRSIDGNSIFCVLCFEVSTNVLHIVIQGYCEFVILCGSVSWLVAYKPLCIVDHHFVSVGLKPVFH